MSGQQVQKTDHQHALAQPDLWDQLLDCTLRLAPHVTFSSQQNRGENLVIVHNPLKNQFFKTTIFVKELLVHLDGEKTIRELLTQNSSLESALLESESSAILMSKLIEAGVVVSDLSIDFEQSIKKSAQQESKKRLMQWVRPWFIRIPIFNPNTLLTVLNKATFWVWSPKIFALWCAWLVLGVLVAEHQWPTLTHYWDTRFFDPQNIILVVFIYPFLKMLHELGHGLSTKRWGGAVHEAGVALLFFMPVPYVDASSSTLFTSKYQRIVVSAAGMIVELTVAVGALLLWTVTDNILIKDICFNIMLIGAVSSLFFNGNPLLRYDAYYMLCDGLELPNLGTQANRYWINLINGFAVGKRESTFDCATVYERAWYFFYGLASYCYRIVLSLWIAIYVASQYLAVGLLLGVWSLTSQWFLPVAAWFKNAMWQSKQAHSQLRFLGVTLMSAVVLLGVVLFVPVDRPEVAKGVIVATGDHLITAGVNGFVANVAVAPGESVSKGAVIMQLKNKELDTKLTHVSMQITQTQLSLNQTLSSASNETAWYRSLLDTYQSEYKDLLKQKQALVVRAKVAGQVTFKDGIYFLGRFVKRGQSIGIVSSKEHRAVFVLTQGQVANIQLTKADSSLKFEASPKYQPVIESVNLIPAATKTLSSKYLGSLFGGQMTVDTSDPKGVTALKPVFEVEIKFHVSNIVQPGVVPGGRMVAKFGRTPQPIGVRVYENLRRKVQEELKL